MSKKKTKITIGVPYYGSSSAQWWAPFVNHVGLFPKFDLEYGGLITTGAMLTDKNRNDIARQFLEGDSEWMFWMDADTITPPGGIRRLLDLDKPLASGLYYGKGKGHIPIAHIRIPGSGAYRPIHYVMEWEPGEIIPVDACGFGSMLTHRSVFEKIKEDFVPLQRYGGGLTLAHKDDIVGEIDPNKRLGQDGMIVDGQERKRVAPPTIENYNFPFFIIEYNRTEDFFFFEIAERAGFKPWLDTSVECGHIRDTVVKGRDFREARLYEVAKERKAKELAEAINANP